MAYHITNPPTSILAPSTTTPDSASTTTTAATPDKTSTKPKAKRRGGGHVRPKAPNPGQTLYSPANCMYVIGIESPVTLSNWIAKGTFPPADMRLGRSPKWRKSTVEAWEAAQPTPEQPQSVA